MSSNKGFQKEKWDEAEFKSEFSKLVEADFLKLLWAILGVIGLIALMCDLMAK